MLTLLDPLLAPLARLMVSRGIGFPELAERLKLHFVRAAIDAGEGKSTDSRISVLTGLQRRDIARLRSDKAKEAHVSHLSRLVATWQTDATYQSPDGKPATLPRAGPQPSFEALARSIRTDIHPRTMLDALIEAGTVTRDAATDEVSLAASAYLPLPGSDEQIAYLANNIGDHLEAATLNVRADEPPFFERAVHYSGLSEADIAELDATFRKSQMDLLQHLNARAARMKNDSRGTLRFRAGGYFYSKEQDQ